MLYIQTCFWLCKFIARKRETPKLYILLPLFMWQYMSKFKEVSGYSTDRDEKRDRFRGEKNTPIDALGRLHINESQSLSILISGFFVRYYFQHIAPALIFFFFFVSFHFLFSRKKTNSVFSTITNTKFVPSVFSLCR